MNALFNYPSAAEFGRIVAKDKIYSRIKATSKIKEKFISQAGKIIWKYKLAKTTINLPETAKVKEIEIFEITLKTEKLDADILRCIDKAIVHPIIFHLIYEGKIKIVATHKRPSESGGHKWVTSDHYFETDWLPIGADRQKLPVVLDLSGLYEHILRQVIQLPAREKETLESQVGRMGEIIAKEKLHQKLESRMNKEKQFNRKVEMNTELRAIAHDIEQLKDLKGA